MQTASPLARYKSAGDASFRLGDQFAALGLRGLAAVHYKRAARAYTKAMRTREVRAVRGGVSP